MLGSCTQFSELCTMPLPTHINVLLIWQPEVAYLEIGLSVMSWAPIHKRIWAKSERDLRENVLESVFEIWAKFKPNLSEILTEFLTEFLSEIWGKYCIE